MQRSSVSYVTSLKVLDAKHSFMAFMAGLAFAFIAFMAGLPIEAAGFFIRRKRRQQIQQIINANGAKPCTNKDGPC